MPFRPELYTKAPIIKSNNQSVRWAKRNKSHHATPALSVQEKVEREGLKKLGVWHTQTPTTQPEAQSMITYTCISSEYQSKMEAQSLIQKVKKKKKVFSFFLSFLSYSLQCLLIAV